MVCRRVLAPKSCLFRRLGIFVLFTDAPVDSSVGINEYLAIDSGGNVSDLVLARN